MVRPQAIRSGPGYLVVFDDGPVGIVEKLVGAPKEDKRRDIPRVNFNDLVVCVSGVYESPMEDKPM